MKKDLSRRQFLKRTAGAASVAAIAPKLLTDPNPIPALSYVPPSDRVRFGIIGIGMQGSGLLTNAITLPGIECVAAADLWDGRHTLAKEICNNPKLFTTRKYQELLDNKEIDCIIAAVPDHWHKRVVVDATSAGKDIYCEKPMSHTAAEGVAMAAAQQKTGRIVQIGSQRVSSVICAKAKEMIAAGAIGKLTLVEGSLGFILLRQDSRPRISIGTPGKAAPPTAPGIRTCLPSGSRVGANGKSTARESPAISSSISSPA